jgi:hypothetical protein
MSVLGQGTNEPQEFENTIICQEVKSVEPKEKIVKKTVVKKTSTKKKISNKFLTAITKVINMKKINMECIPVEISKPFINCDKLKELQIVIDNCLIIIGELQEEIKELKQEAETKELAENFFDNPEIDPVYRYTVWYQKQYFTNRCIEEIKQMRHPIFKGIDEEEEVIKTNIVVEEEEVKPDKEVVEIIQEVIKTIEEEEVKPDDKKEIKKKDTYAKTKQRNKELKTKTAISILFEEEFDTSKPYLCDIEGTEFKEMKNYKTRISNALKWIDESLEDCFHLEYTHSIIYNTKKKETYLHLTDNETGKLFVRLCANKIYYDTVSLYNKPNQNGAKFTMKKIDKKPLVVMFEKLKNEIINILPT